MRDDELRNVMLGGMPFGMFVPPQRASEKMKKWRELPEKAKERAAPERKNTGDLQEVKPAEDELDEKARRVLEWNNTVQEKRRQREEEKARKEEDKARKEEERARK